MPESRPIENEFLNQLTAIVEERISNEQFGVSELADKMNMSRSNLLRKVKKETKLSVSQLISQIRLKRAMDILRKSSLNVSEVSHQVGFNSTSYFIKCFREYYGYPPGEVGKRNEVEEPSIAEGSVPKMTNRKRIFLLIGSAGLVLAIAVGLFTYYTLPSSGSPLEKSIAVLPFKNDSNDSTNVYLINGLMESTLNNLQKIQDLKVISRTSAEKYRNTTRSIPEMAKELNVNYFVEGSGQKIGDQLLLNIQLIEASSDRHLWSKQYRREAKDIFELQQEIAKNIADEIQAIITPEEKKRIEKKPTDDLVAYDMFLKGRDRFYKGGTENLEKAILYFQKAIELDRKFALAYAEAVLVYYYLDFFQAEKKYGKEITSYADKALEIDPRLPNSLVAKALVHMHKHEYELAVPYFERALEYNPNSVQVIHFLADVYNNNIPNTARYLEYALKGVRLEGAAHDSVTTSYNYLHLSNALIQTGFVDESLTNINKSLAYNPENFFSSWVRAFILYAKSRDLEQTKQLLIKQLEKDTMQIVLVEEIGKVCYLMRDFKSAYKCYTKFLELREAAQLDIYKHESLKFAVVLSKMGQKKKAEEFAGIFKNYADNDRTIYKNANLAGYYCYRGDVRKTIDYLKLFSKEDNYQYWMLLINDDPLFDPIKDHPEFIKVTDDIKAKFWATHKKLRMTLEEKELL